MVIFPWSLVNMTGAPFWGVVARQLGFKKYGRTPRSSALVYTWFLLRFGLVGAVVMSIPGALVQAALNEHSIFALNQEAAESLSYQVTQWESAVRVSLESILGLQGGTSVGLS